MKQQRLDPLLERARHREEAVAIELASLSRDLASHEQRLAELRAYADEAPAPGQALLAPAALQNRAAFRARIDEAVARQAGTVEASRLRCERERERLLQANRDTRVLENLAANYRDEARRDELRREQKQLDELAGRRASRRGPEGETA